MKLNGTAPLTERVSHHTILTRLGAGGLGLVYPAGDQVVIAGRLRNSQLQLHLIASTPGSFRSKGVSNGEAGPFKQQHNSEGGQGSGLQTLFARHYIAAPRAAHTVYISVLDNDDRSTRKSSISVKRNTKHGKP